MDFLGSPLWSGISVLATIVVAIIATALTFIQIYKARNRKILAYDIVSIASVVTVNKEVKSRVKILLDNNPIQDARLVVIEVLNGGDIPIQTTDYEKNTGITFDFGSGAEVLNIDLLDTSPKTLRPSLSFKSEHVLLEPLLLNNQDSFRFKALVTGFEGYIKVEGRVSGVREIIPFDDLPHNVRGRMLEKLAFIGMATGMGGSAIALATAMFLEPNPSKSQLTPYYPAIGWALVTSFSIFFICLLYLLLRIRKYKLQP